MTELYCTQKLLKELGDYNFPSVHNNSKSLMGDWYINIFKIERYKTLIFVNERTLFSFVKLQVKKKDTQNILQVFLQGLESALLMTKQDTNVVKKILCEYIGIQGLRKSNNRQITGNMVDLMQQYKCMIQLGGDINDIILKVNNMPQRNLDWNFSTEVLRDIVQEQFIN